MCILFIAIRQHPDYPLIIAANRDEYHARPSEAMHQWQDQPDILAGRDLQAGGTWLGVNHLGRFAAVTNFRTPAPPPPNALSRGALVVNALHDEGGFDSHIDQQHARYSPFNLIYGDSNGLQAWGHRRQARRQLRDGFHSVSNGPIDEYWPKMAQGVAQLSQMISRQDDLDPDKLTTLMQDQTRAPAEELPDTGIDAGLESTLSSIFIAGETYGTRTTSILLFGYNEISITETNYAPDTSIASVSTHHLKPA